MCEFLDHFTDKPKFVVVPTFEYYRFNCYKLLFFKIAVVPTV
ncbi:hypothetical protein LEP1GSC074_0010 [Leptospira noguchii str. Hook]|uniref:Uncharacterized protein n=1 Tax=Leptospira noguchii serovar Autumnalis str. ZUN142 TaxID=1085540 RepID=M6U293_9LEPT|nr:hypothetical protein LEP1GSC041_0162 [Leptospira noguchii str. 2006001870]EMO39162.1 hypothetical protein LEP1GSC186_2837 [Leptospira noguchii serovar Autumnalis str. ZUN142]EMS81929.1 hypothetical protein LEP1GSC074_0010 [Leptospira noguchii str. Hook]EMS89601.1 hypothetical protein LEP1GSC073_2082 [Leptospira noguchii str. Cascata]